MKRPQIISIGELVWDLFPDGERFGGAVSTHFALPDPKNRSISLSGNGSVTFSKLRVH
jgi:hypothetical protein